MYPYIVCFCGRSLGDLYDIFKLLREIKYQKLDSEVDPMLYAITESVQIDLVDVFEQLNIHMDCCRTRMNTQVEFKDIY